MTIQKIRKIFLRKSARSNRLRMYRAQCRSGSLASYYRYVAITVHHPGHYAIDVQKNDNLLIDWPDQLISIGRVIHCKGTARATMILASLVGTYKYSNTVVVLYKWLTLLLLRTVL